MIVVKVGGSLVDHPGLRAGLQLYFTPVLGSTTVLLVPGGGPAAEAVRAWDQVHCLGEERSHWLALESTGPTGTLLANLLSCGKTGRPDRAANGFVVLDAFGYAAAFDDPARYPHSWAATSDSLAAWVAEREAADRLTLLKSVDVPPGTPWDVAAGNGWVDAYFPAAAGRARCPVEVVNFRRWMDERGIGK